MTDEKPKPPHPDKLSPVEAARVKSLLRGMVIRGRAAGDPFLDAFSRSSTVALATNDEPRK